MHKYYLFLLFFSLLTNNFFLAQWNPEQIRRKFKQVEQIIPLSSTTLDEANALVLLISKSKVQIYQTDREEILVTEKIKDPNQAYQLQAIKESSNQILILFGITERKAFLISKTEILFPSIFERRNEDLMQREGFNNMLVYGYLNPNHIYHEGLIDLSGNILLPALPHQLMDYDPIHRSVICKHDKNFGVTGLDGNIIIPSEQKYIQQRNGIYVVENLHEWVGVTNLKDTLLPFVFKMPDRYRQVFKDQSLQLELEHQNMTFDFEQLLSNQYMNQFSMYKSVDYYSKFNIHYKFGSFQDEETITYIINAETNDTILGPPYQFGNDLNFHTFKGGVPCVLNGKWGMIHLETKKVMIPFEYDVPYLKNSPYSNIRYRRGAFGISTIALPKQSVLDTNILIIAKKNGQYGLIDLNGQQKTPFEYDGIYTFLDCKNPYLIAVKKDDLFGIMDTRTFKVVVPIAFEEIHDCRYGRKSLLDEQRTEFPNFD